MNSSKNKLNSKISWLKIIYPNTKKHVFGLNWKIKIILLFNLILLLFMSPIALFNTIHGPTVLFELTFTFIYNTFSNKFSVSIK